MLTPSYIIRVLGLNYLQRGFLTELNQKEETWSLLISPSREEGKRLTLEEGAHLLKTLEERPCYRYELIPQKEEVWLKDSLIEVGDKLVYQGMSFPDYQGKEFLVTAIYGENITLLTSHAQLEGSEDVWQRVLSVKLDEVEIPNS